MEMVLKIQINDKIDAFDYFNNLTSFHNLNGLVLSNNTILYLEL